MERFLPLGDGRARDPAVAGSKVAGLVRAASRGLPVLPGWVLPTDDAAGALRAGLEKLERSGPAAACLAISERPLDPAVLGDLKAVGAAFPNAIVRSSTAVDADPAWAGAFATYVDVGADDLPAAIRGCWASALSRDVLARCAATRRPPADLRIAVLVQPWIAFEAGGTAVARADGSVRVLAATGPPVEVGSGRGRGGVATVSRNGAVLLASDPALDRTIVTRVADLARSVVDETIEWGWADGELIVLQLRPTPRARARPSHRPRGAPGLSAAIAQRVASIAARFPGPLGDRFALPWACAVDAPLVAAIEVEDGLDALDEACELAAALAAEAWNLPPAEAERAAARTLRSILGTDPGRGLRRLSMLRPVDPARARRLLGLILGIGRSLVEREILTWEELVWRLSVEELRGALGPAGRRPPERMGPGRWDPFVFTVASTFGRAVPADAAADGIGAGRARAIDGSTDERRAGGRDVLVLIDPVPQVAPLLWNAAGLVACRGSAGAHLFEVARSLGVPAVLGVDPADVPDGSLAAVHGDDGTVFVLRSGGIPSIGTVDGPTHRSAHADVGR